MAKTQFWYLDTDATTVTDNNATNLGMRQRALLSHGNQTVEAIIPLNRYACFESLSDRLLPPMQLEFEIELQDDREMIFQNDGTAGRIVVRDFVLWVPQLHFTGKGLTLVNENFLQPTAWKYMKETLHVGGARRVDGLYLITPGVKKPKHVFVFFQQTRKKDTYTQNPYLFDTFDIDGDDSAKLVSCHPEYGTSFYPETDYTTNKYIMRNYNDLINFRYRKNDYNSGVQLQLANFKKLYPVIYFDLRNVEESKTNDPEKLEFHFTLNKPANAPHFIIYAAVLNEEEFVLKKLGNELVVV